MQINACITFPALGSTVSFRGRGMSTGVLRTMLRIENSGCWAMRLALSRSRHMFVPRTETRCKTNRFLIDVKVFRSHVLRRPE